MYRATEQFETENRHGARETPHRLDAWTSLASSVEPVGLSLAHWLVLTSWSTPDSESINLQGWVGELSWVYLSFLYLVRMGLLPFAPPLRVQSLRVHVFYHSSCLYGVHWALTAILFRTSYLKYGTTSEWSPLTAGFVVTSALFCSALQQPLSVVANEIVATGPIAGRTLRAESEHLGAGNLQLAGPDHLERNAAAFESDRRVEIGRERFQLLHHDQLRHLCVSGRLLSLHTTLISTSTVLLAAACFRLSSCFCAETSRYRLPGHPRAPF